MLNAPRGINFSSQELTAPDLARALCRVVCFLQDVEPQGVQLQKYADWWEHDGLHFPKGTISIHELFEMVESPRSMLASMQGDDDVFIGIAPHSQLWYLRFYLAWDSAGFELNGRFDITLPTDVAFIFKRQVLGALNMKEQDATTYYQSIRL